MVNGTVVGWDKEGKRQELGSVGYPNIQIIKKLSSQRKPPTRQKK